jgi:hypothetical protein
MAIKHIIVLFVETPRKFITAVNIFIFTFFYLFIYYCSDKFTWCFHKQNYYKTINILILKLTKQYRIGKIEYRSCKLITHACMHTVLTKV